MVFLIVGLPWSRARGIPPTGWEERKGVLTRRVCVREPRVGCSGGATVGAAAGAPAGEAKGRRVGGGSGCPGRCVSLNDFFMPVILFAAVFAVPQKMLSCQPQLFLSAGTRPLLGLATRPQ